ncbi:MAG: shikimate dehydrogenase [Bacilli bacterium]|nr:shikimate dehydrogenase [Bacilli bacterium]
MEYGLIGHPLKHSYSKIIHEGFGFYSYDLMDLEEEELDAFLEKKDFKGINVTIPYKQKVIPYLDEIDESVKLIGACNCIVNKDGRLIGYNTDYDGLKGMLLAHHFDLENKKVAILGTGGTSKTSKEVAKSLKAKSIINVSRHPSPDVITYDELEKIKEDIDVIFNTTPVGMYPSLDDKPLTLEDFSRLKYVVDVIYNPLRTSLTLEAKSRAIPTLNGLEMLVGQAYVAAEKFLNKKLDPSLLKKAYQDLYLEKVNIVLIGMPSSGKTTIGQALAKALNREFIDTDKLVEERIKEPIADYIPKYGAPAFRKVESEVVESLKLETGKIISTGGGVILNEKNVLNLSYYGRLYFLDRPLDKLTPTGDRPLSSDINKLKMLYEARYSLYRKYADVIIDASGTLEEEIDSIRKDLLL